jgi:hypothetical protein
MAAAFQRLQRVISKLIKGAAVSSINKEGFRRTRSLGGADRSPLCAARHLPYPGTSRPGSACIGWNSGIRSDWVAKGKDGVFEAHAWLEAEGKILLGGSDSNQRYTRLLALDRGTP